MSVISGKEIRKRKIFSPHHPRTQHKTGTSFGEGPASYDICLKEDITIRQGFTTLAVSAEHFTMPHNLCASVKDKSTWARLGIDVKNTFIDPGWTGYLTLEIGYAPIFYASSGLYGSKVSHTMVLKGGTPIAQIVFEEVKGKVKPYDGKYQNQGSVPVSAITNER